MHWVSKPHLGQYGNTNKITAVTYGNTNKITAEKTNAWPQQGALTFAQSSHSYCQTICHNVRSRINYVYIKRHIHSLRSDLSEDVGRAVGDSKHGNKAADEKRGVFSKKKLNLLAGRI